MTNERIASTFERVCTAASSADDASCVVASANVPIVDDEPDAIRQAG